MLEVKWNRGPWSIVACSADVYFGNVWDQDTHHHIYVNEYVDFISMQYE